MADYYAFSPVLGDLGIHLLVQGEHHQIYAALGAHCREHEGIPGVSFVVWAPNARRVSVVGDFNEWDGRRCPMRLRHVAGVWEIFVPDLAAAHCYKYEIVAQNGVPLPLKTDPYAGWSERPPGTASRIAAPSRHRWDDGAWLERRWQTNDRHAPISIYEVHLGSWRRRIAEGGRYLGYRELAEELIPYVCDLGFRHLELLPVTEFPFDGSWGYRQSGFSRRRVGSAIPTTSAISSMPATLPASLFGSTGCWRISRPMRTGSRASTAPRSTSTPIRTKASSATGTHTPIIMAGGRLRTFSWPMRAIGSRSSTRTGCASMLSLRCSISTTADRLAAGSRTASVGVRTSRRSTS